MKPVTVVELPGFVTAAGEIWPDDEVMQFVDWIARHPLAGDVIPGTGGIRKVRWQASGRGKRGGARVIYYFRSFAMPVFLLTAYAKGDQADMTSKQRKRMIELVRFILEEYRS